MPVVEFMKVHSQRFDELRLRRQNNQTNKTLTRCRHQLLINIAAIKKIYTRHIFAKC